MTRDPVLYERRQSVGILRLNRPGVHNAVDPAVVARLEECLDELERDAEVRVVVLTAAGNRTFCAGADLDWIATLENHRQGLELSRRMRGVLGRLADGPRPVIAAVNGDALGGGCEILMACHQRIAVASARFSFRQAAMGVITGWGGGARLLRLLPRPLALRLLLTAETIEAGAALRLGLIDRIAGGDGLMAEAAELAERIAVNSADSVAAFLELARAVDHDSAPQVARREEEIFERLWDGEHFRRRVAGRQEARG